MSNPGASRGRSARMISRSRRRVLLRSTAPPTRLEVTRPMRLDCAAESLRTPRRSSRPCEDFPFSRTLRKSRLLRRRAVFGKRSRARSGLGVSGEVDFDTFREKPFAAVTAAAAQDGSAGLGLHAGAEAELLFARALGRLVCAFHKIGKWRRETRRISQGVNLKSHSPKNLRPAGNDSQPASGFFGLARVHADAYDPLHGAKYFGRRSGALLLRTDDGVFPGWLLPHRARRFGGSHRLRSDDKGISEILVRTGQ